MSDPQGRVRDLVGAREHELVAFRRRLHSYPELSGEEHGTTQAIVERLLVAGLEPTVLARGTGLVCDIVGRSDGPLVVLRADIDALAMDDLTESEHSSRNPGVAHACGHDVHTTVVLGAGLVLRALAEEGALRGTVRLLFEPAEESVPGGAVDVIEEGWLDGASAVFGLHCDPKIDVGLIGLRSGAMTAASDAVEIVLTGPGGHTARPHLTVDLVRVTADVVRELPDALARHLDAADRVLLVFGAVHSGDAANVIPARSVLRASLRTPDVEVWDRAEKALGDALAEMLSGSGVGWEVAYQRGVPPVVNDDAALAVLTAAAADVVGPAGVVETPRSMGGDTFAWYGRVARAAYGRLGTHGGGMARLDLHASTFDVDERAIALGARTLAGAALRALA